MTGLVSLFQWDMNEPLKRCKAEPFAASQALNDYAVQGSMRSISKLLFQYKELHVLWLKYLENPQAWLDAGRKPPEEPPTIKRSRLVAWSGKFQWDARIERWDEMRKRMDQLEFDLKRSELKKMRIEIMEMTMMRLKAALVSLDPKDASWGEVTAGITKISESMRDELGDSGAGAGLARHRIQTVVINVPNGAGPVLPSIDMSAVVEGQEIKNTEA